MKNTIIKFSAAFFIALMAGSCAKFTEIDPKGTNMLQTVSDIDMLLNHRFYSSIYENSQTNWLMNDLQPGLLTPAYSIINEPRTNPVRTALYTWDASIDRATATETDATYTGLYGIIGKICNPVLVRADVAKGDRATANRLKAEAYILRVWHHYMLVNMYAKAYDPATAAEDGGIPYSRETDMLSTPNPQYTMQKVYDFMIEDLDAAFALNSLSVPSSNRMRVNSAFANAVKAKVLMSMRNYDGAYQAAAAALAIENTVDDYNRMLIYNPENSYDPVTYEPIGGFSFSRPEMSSREDLFYAGSVYLLFLGCPPELKAAYEAGNIFCQHTSKYTGYGPVYFGVADMDMWFDNDVYMNCGGLSTVDMYLLQAECLIRKGDATNIAAGMDILNMIRRHRVATEVYDVVTAGYDTPDIIDPADYYSPWTATNQAEAIAYLKQMVHTECWYGPKRYMEVKRWNTESVWKETLTKHIDAVNGSEIVPYDYTLSPDSPLWIFPFPSKSIGLNSNLSQNY